MWLTKTSAPQDGSWFLAINKEFLNAYAPYEFVFWNGGQFSSSDTSEEVDFEYWAPLPVPPGVK
ncbi:hypothetical protein SAMN04487995_1764 [Dyadobacter koreensis]|uniref:DUF551 domain-containing protein n=1 Tax=Dyadobacter koreensis TaxID=408657 RepID=A0A1H6SPH9_9BACT|nr:hypothetical protein [Dyadobacter koreensis]SEI69839.1 hypothetical protein SAMN04487995_1764 [Dyadobacter koreensis]